MNWVAAVGVVVLAGTAVGAGVGRADGDGDLREHAIRRLPIEERGRVVGIVTLGDVAVDADRRSALADISAAPPNV
jgi:CBS domain-containing protein